MCHLSIPPAAIFLFCYIISYFYKKVKFFYFFFAAVRAASERAAKTVKIKEASRFLLLISES